MKEKLLTDYLKEKNLIKSDNPKLIGIQNIGECIYVFEFSPNSSDGLYEVRHKIKTIDILAWLYNKIKH